MSESIDTVPATPDIRLRGDPPRVMRLSRKTLGFGALLASVGIGGSLFYALQPAHKQATEELYNTDSHSTADSLASAPKDYSQIPKLGPPLPGDLGRPILAAEQRGVNMPPPQMGPGAGSQPANNTANAAQAARQRAQQERDSARLSKVFLGGGAVREAGSDMGAPPADLPAAARPDILNPGGAAVAQATPPADASQNDQTGKRAFMTAANRPTATGSALQPPSSPYVLQAGSVIAAALITGIRSDLPGQITAQVTENVYDSPTGRILLIPQGSKLIGEYDSQISFGQNRVLLAWDRLILPGGQSIALDRQPGADAAGFAGLQDRTDQHWGGIIKAALLSTVLGIGAEVGSNGDDDLIRAIRQGSSDTINQTGQQIVRRQLNIQPTLTIRPGYPVRVIVTRDLVLAPIAGGMR